MKFAQVITNVKTINFAGIRTRITVSAIWKHACRCIHRLMASLSVGKLKTMIIQQRKTLWSMGSTVRVDLHTPSAKTKANAPVSKKWSGMIQWLNLLSHVIQRIKIWLVNFTLILMRRTKHTQVNLPEVTSKMIASAPSTAVQATQPLASVQMYWAPKTTNELSPP